MHKYIFPHKYLYLTILLLIAMASCNGQDKREKNEKANVGNRYNIYGGVEIYTQPAVDTVLKFSSPVRAIFEDSKGNFWFGSDKDGVCCYDGKVYTYYTMKDGLCGNQIRTIQEDGNGNVWFGTGSGVCNFDGLNFTTFTNSKHLKTRGNSEQDWKKEEGDLWFDAGAKNGVYRYDGKQFTYLSFPVPKEDTSFNRENVNVPPYMVYKIYKDKKGNVWFGTNSRGVVGYDGKTFTYIREGKFGLTPVRSLFQDASGAYWFGDNGIGLFHYDGKQLTNFTAKHGLENKDFLKGHNADKPGTLARIWGTEQDQDGLLWFATIDAGLWSYDGISLTNYTQKDGLGSNAIHTIFKDKKGDLWFGTGDGNVYTQNGKYFTTFSNSKK